MKDEKETIELCPILYKMANRPMNETCMCYGFDCGKGWLNCIHDMSCELEVLNIQYYSQYKLRIQMNQVKEKFGLLTCYFSVEDDDKSTQNNIKNLISEYLYIKGHEIIQKYENKCYNICEDCGIPIGTDWSPRIKTKDWINYICENCDKKRTLEKEKYGES